VEEALERARAGDGAAFGALTDPFVSELRLHCYRMLGSLPDAEDMVQETLLSAWRGLTGFEERASVRTWLYRIATNRCLNALRASSRRPRTAAGSSAGSAAAGLAWAPEPTRLGEPLVSSPYPDALLEGLPDGAAGPEARYESREAIALAFVSAVRHLPPRQRAVLVLRDVLGFRAAEVAEMLGVSEAAVNSALRRARGTMERSAPGRGASRPQPRPRSAREREVADLFAAAFTEGDVDGIVALLTDDAWCTMPPAWLSYQGPSAIGGFLRAAFGAHDDRRYRLVAAGANGQPAFVVYMSSGGPFVAWGAMVLEVEGERISALTRFGEVGLEGFGLARELSV
jgi:RNA polymerase sigma-70 factor (TIGR02960 family)